MDFSLTCPTCMSGIATGHDRGFSATTVVVTPCDSCQGAGITDVTIRKSRAAELETPTQVVSHRDGLVVFA